MVASDADVAPVPGSGGSRPIQSSIAQERSFRVDGKKIVVTCVLPARLADEIGMEAMLACAKALKLDVEGKQVKVVALKLGEN